MRLINAFKIAVNNFSLVFKDILYKVIVFSILGAILGLILKINLKPFFERLTPVIKDFTDILTSIMKNGDYSEIAESLKTHLYELKDYFSIHVGNLFLLTGICVLFVFLYRFFSGVSDCTVLILVNGYMGTLSHRGYIGVMLENLKKIVVYQLIDALISIVYFFLIVLVDGVLLRAMIGTLPLVAVFLCAAITFSAGALYSTCLSQVMSNMLVGNMKVKESFKKGILPKKNYFWKMFAAYLVALVGFMYLATTTAVFTLGVGTVIVMAFFTVIMASMRQVDYFTINKMKYFIDYDNIIVPKELRENDEQLLNKIEI